MTKTLRCPKEGDGCTFEATGDTREEVVQRTAAHAKNEHGTAVSAELVDKLKRSVSEG